MFPCKFYKILQNSIFINTQGLSQPHGTRIKLHHQLGINFPSGKKYFSKQFLSLFLVLKQNICSYLLGFYVGFKGIF